MSHCNYKNKDNECTQPRLKCKHMKIYEVGGDSFHSYEFLEYKCKRPNTKHIDKTDHCTNP